jgi:hypothetical protein
MKKISCIFIATVFGLTVSAQVTFLIPHEYPVSNIPNAKTAVEILNDAVAKQPNIRGTHLFISIDDEKIVRSSISEFAYEDMYYVKVQMEGEAMFVIFYAKKYGRKTSEYFRFYDGQQARDAVSAMIALIKAKKGDNAIQYKMQKYKRLSKAGKHLIYGDNIAL